MTQVILATLALITGTAPPDSSLLSAPPAQVWLYDGSAQAEDRLTGLLTDRSTPPCCYLTGYSYQPHTDFDFWTVKVNFAGETIWTARHGSAFNCDDRIWTSVLDRSGNLIAGGGSIADLDMDWDFHLVKYDPKGRVLWSRHYDLSEQGDDKPAAAAVGTDNSIYLTGSAQPRRKAARRDSDVITIRLAPTGETLWTRLLDGGARLDDAGVAIAVDSPGNCYVAARITSRPQATDIALLKYSPAGRLLWKRIIDGPGNKADLPIGLLLSRQVEPVLIGTVTGRVTSFDYYVGAFDILGRTRWERTLDAAGRVDVPAAAYLDSAGNVIITGQSTAATSFDILTLSYSAAGRLCWTHRYNGASNGADRGLAVAAAADRVYVGGSSDGVSGYPDLIVIALAPADSLTDSTDCRLLWSYRYSGGGTGESRAVALSVLPAGLLVGGYTCRPSSSFDYLLLRLEGR